MPDTELIIDCLRVEQPIGVYYVGVMAAADLEQIAYVDMLEIREQDGQEDRYSGIQRPLDLRRVKEISEYANTVDAAFPTSIIIAVSSEDAQYFPETKTMKIQRKRNVAKVIDGQHRLAGLSGFLGSKFELNVTVFVDMEVEDQAMMFATINLNQTKVNKSIAYSLLEYASSRSPYRSCHDIAKLLNATAHSPFKGKIKILGVATGARTETLTQAMFVERLVVYISDRPMKDRDDIKRGKRPIDLDEKKFIFRKLWIESKDELIAKYIWNLFTAVAQRWPDAWIQPQEGIILNRTTGFGAIMRFLQDVYLGLSGPEFSVPNILSILAKHPRSGEEFTTDNYPPGTSGETKFYNELLQCLRG